MGPIVVIELTSALGVKCTPRKGKFRSGTGYKFVLTLNGQSFFICQYIPLKGNILYSKPTPKLCDILSA